MNPCIYVHACVYYLFHVYVHTGLKYCKINVHLLSHLPHFVKLFGPLWTHSAFAVEDSIGHLVSKAHGTHDIANQVYMYFVRMITVGDHLGS